MYLSSMGILELKNKTPFEKNLKDTYMYLITVSIRKTHIFDHLY